MKKIILRPQANLRKYFGYPGELPGEISLDLDDDNISIRDICKSFNILPQDVFEITFFADGQSCDFDYIPKDGDIIELLPIVSGG